MKEILKYKLENNKEPFNEWFKKLDWKTQAKLDAYIVRLALGAAKKNVKPVGDGVFELKVDYGPGYRLYFGEVGKTIILLLLGGDKKTQKKDIRTAKEYWRNYNE